MLLSGAYNLGFLAVWRRPALMSFLRWWQDKLRFLCLDEPANGVFVDQKWMDLVPGLFPEVVTLRHPGYNVAYWNLRQRPISATDGRFTVHGEPLRFFHFSGFGPALPDRVSRYSTLRLSAVGDARKLFADYALAIRDAGRASFETAAYAYASFADGSPVQDAVRFAYRNSSELQAAAGADPFARPELFASARRHAKVRAASRRVLAGARPLVRLLSPDLHTSLRALLRGR
jgi:hypothetical protein